jgi:hypothetical protein
MGSKKFKFNENGYLSFDETKSKSKEKQYTTFDDRETMQESVPPRYSSSCPDYSDDQPTVNQSTPWTHVPSFMCSSR